MKRKNVFLSLLLSVMILIISQPAYAKSTNEVKLLDTDTETSLEITEEETKPITLDEIVTNKKAALNTENSKSNKFVGETVFNKAASSKFKSFKAVSGGPDLAIGNLTIKSPTQPFSYTDYTNFEMLVGNVGGTSISNVKLTVHVDNIQVLIQNFGTFNPGYGGTITVPLKGLCGSHQVKFSISGDATETRMDNNSCGGNFVWQSVIDLAALAPVQVEDPIVCGEEFSAKVPIANYGNLPATGVAINFELAGKDAGSTTLDIPAMTKKTLTLKITFFSSGAGQLTVKVDKNSKINDADRSNNYAVKQFSVIPEKDATIGKYLDATNIRIGIAPSTRDLLDGLGKHISFSDAKTAMLKWNGITNKAKVGYVATVDSESPSDCDVVLRTYPGTRDDFIAETNAYTDGSIIEPSLRHMDLNKYFFDGNDNSIQKKELKRTLTHETGHVFGLDHPRCRSIAIMHQSVLLKDGIASYDIELHDKANLKYLYS